MAPICALAFAGAAFGETSREPAVWNRVLLMLVGFGTAVFAGILLTGPNGSGSGRHRVLYVLFFWLGAGALVGVVLDLVVR